MAFADIPAAETEAQVRVDAGTMLEALGCFDHAGTPAIYSKHPIGAAGTYDDGRPKTGAWGWLTA